MIKAERIYITELTLDMVAAIHLNSLDEDNRKFNPDEVFETIEEAQDAVEFLMSAYKNGGGPLVYPVLLIDGTNIGYVQAVPMAEGKWEVGYHIAKAYAGNGYATEAVKSFLPIIMNKLDIREIFGICLAENIASIKVLEKAGFTKVFEGMGTYQNKERKIYKYVYKIK